MASIRSNINNSNSNSNSNSTRNSNGRARSSNFRQANASYSNVPSPIVNLPEEDVATSIPPTDTEQMPASIIVEQVPAPIVDETTSVPIPAPAEQVLATTQHKDSQMFELLLGLITNQQKIIERLDQQQQVASRAPTQVYPPQMVLAPPQLQFAFKPSTVAQHHVAQPHVAQPHVAQPHVAQPHVAQPSVAQSSVPKPIHVKQFAATGTSKPAPKHTRDTEVEKAPFDLNLEEECPEGYKCPHSKDTKKCPKNHQRLGNVIKRNAVIPKHFCKYERPWILVKSEKKPDEKPKPMRCHNPECFFAHLEGRAKWLAFYFNKSKQETKAE
jgi:hypothetical protein